MGWFRNDARRPAAVAVSSTRCIACPAAIQSVTSSDSVTMRASSAEPSTFVVLRGLGHADVERAHDQRADRRLQLGQAEGVARHSVVARRVADSHPMSKLPAEGQVGHLNEVGLGDQARQQPRFRQDVDQPRSLGQSRLCSFCCVTAASIGASSKACRQVCRLRIAANCSSS